MVAYLKLLIAKMKRERFGQSAERGRKLVDRLELQLEELEASATEDEVAAGPAEPEASSVRATRKKPVRAPLPAHLPREPVVVPAPPRCHVLRRQARQTGRGPRPRGRAAAMEGNRAREVHLPVVRKDHPAAGTIPRHCPGAGRSQPVGDDPFTPSSASISRSTGRARAMRGRVLSSTCRPWRTS
jgi:Transposase C of IS166 homeodomain